jgi:hypothetical protein
MSADEVMASILHMAQNMDEDVTAPGLLVSSTPAPRLSLFGTPSPRLSLLVAVRTADADTTPVALVEAVVSSTSEGRVVA